MLALVALSWIFLDASTLFALFPIYVPLQTFPKGQPRAKAKLADLAAIQAESHNLSRPAWAVLNGCLQSLCDEGGDLLDRGAFSCTSVDYLTLKVVPL